MRIKLNSCCCMDVLAYSEICLKVTFLKTQKKLSKVSSKWLPFDGRRIHIKLLSH